MAWAGGTVDVAFHGGVCVRPRQGKRVGRWYDITSETGAVRLQIDCITTSLIEVDGGFCGLISGFALEVVLAKGKEHTQEWSHGSQGESPAVRNVPVPF